MPTHFMCEGVTAYVPIACLHEFLHSVRSCAAPGSTLAIDFAPPRRGETIASRALLLATRLGTAVMGEQIVTLLSPDEVVALLTDTGWNSVDLGPTTESSTVVFAAATAQ